MLNPVPNTPEATFTPDASTLVPKPLPKPRAKRKMKAKQPMILVQLQTRNQMLDPKTKKIFRPLEVTPVDEITPWLRCQLAAKLFTIVE